jgi:uncharacterized protein
MIHPTFKPYMPQVIKLLKKHKIKSAYFFGSVLTDKFNENSDVDFLVNFQENLEPLEKGQLWWDLHDSLRDSLHREIDIVSEKSIKNPYFMKQLSQTRIKIYG